MGQWQSYRFATAFGHAGPAPPASLCLTCLGLERPARSAATRKLTSLSRKPAAYQRRDADRHSCAVGEPAPAAERPVQGLRGDLRVFACRGLLCVPILAPLPDIAVHVV